MGQEITASYVWTVEELIRARENHARAQCRPGYRAGIKFLSLMAILGGWCCYQADGWSSPAVLVPIVFHSVGNGFVLAVQLGIWLGTH